MIAIICGVTALVVLVAATLALAKSWKHIDWTITRYHFAHSSYISVIWSWFLEFSGKAAAPFLLVSVLYAGLKLTNPAFIATLGGFDVFVNVAQNLALDMGGLGLLAVAQQVEKQGNKNGAKFARRVGWAMFVLMIINLSVSSLSTAFGWKESDFAWFIGLLLVGRAILAVSYGIIIHDLGSGDEADHKVVKSSDVVVKLNEYTEALQQSRQETETRLGQIQTLTETHIQKVAEGLQLLAANTEQRILSVVELIQVSGQETERQLAALAQTLESSNEGRFLSLAEKLHAHTDACIETVVTELREQSQALSLLSDLSTKVGLVSSQVGQANYGIETVVTELREQSQALSGLSDLPTQIEAFEEQARVEWSTVQITVEKHMQTLPKLAERIVNSVPETHRITAPKLRAESKSEGRKEVKAKGSVAGSANSTAGKTEGFDKKEFVRECLREDPEISISVIQQKALLQGQNIATGYVSETRTAFFKEQQRANVIEENLSDKAKAVGEEG